VSVSNSEFDSLEIEKRDEILLILMRLEINIDVDGDD
jgi:hypothetical protein